MQFNPNSWIERRKRVQEPLSLVEMASFYKAQQQYVELLEELVREYQRFANIYAEYYPFHDLDGRFEDLNQRAKALLEGESE